MEHNDNLVAVITAESAAISAGAADILLERVRQITEKGYDDQHDDQHNSGELAMAAACYAAYPFHIYEVSKTVSVVNIENGFRFTDPWPFHFDFDKRPAADQRRLLVMAGAFIAAEIDRLDRIEARADEVPEGAAA